MTKFLKEYLGVPIRELDVPQPFSGRIYSSAEKRKAIEKIENEIPGEVLSSNSNQDLTNNGLVDLKKCSHVARNLRIYFGFLVADIHILDTPSGRDLYSLIDSEEGDKGKFKVTVIANVLEDYVTVQNIEVQSINYVIEKEQSNVEQ